MTEENTRVNEIIEKVPWYTVPGILLGVPALAWILSAISRSFYVNVIWKYYWGPIKADGSERGSLVVDGVTAAAGYNLVNTVSWAVLLFVCVLGAAQLLHRFRVPMENKMILAATGWVITGSVFHVLQDSQLFRQPLEFFFITPPIWLIYAAFGVGSMVLGVYFRYVQNTTGSVEQALQKVWFLFIIFVLIYTILWMREWDQVVVYLNPMFVALYAAVAFFVVRAVVKRYGGIEPWMCVMLFPIGWFLLGLHYTLLYSQEPWPGRTPDSTLSFTLWVVPITAGAVTAVAYFVGKKLAAKGYENAGVFTLPINLVIIFSQMVDAFATAVGIDIGAKLGHGYSEKHVLSEAVRHWTERIGDLVGSDFVRTHPTFFGFATVKLIVSLLVVYAIDVWSKEDAKKYPTLIGLIKLAIIMVGIGPGVRNMVRMTLGI